MEDSQKDGIEGIVLHNEQDFINLAVYIFLYIMLLHIAIQKL